MQYNSFFSLLVDRPKFKRGIINNNFLYFDLHNRIGGMQPYIGHIPQSYHQLYPIHQGKSCKILYLLAVDSKN
jgi:hypothetical protein